MDRRGGKEKKRKKREKGWCQKYMGSFLEHDTHDPLDRWEMIFRDGFVFYSIILLGLLQQLEI